MKIPHRLRVDREVYKVVYGDPRKIPGAGPSAIGHCSPFRRMLTLSSSLKTDRRLREWTFFHELFHAVDHEYGLELGHGRIDKLGRAFAYLAEDNGLEFRRGGNLPRRGPISRRRVPKRPA